MPGRKPKDNSLPFFTIITAALNSGSTIEKTMESVRGQTFFDLEHIIIDGGSNDRTLGIIREFEETYDLYWLSEPDRGIADALNKGLKRAKGKYIIVLHADDCLVDEDSLSGIYPLLKNELYDIYTFPVILRHPSHGLALLKPIRPIWWHHFKTIFMHQGTFVHRRVFDSVGQFRTSFAIALDYDFFYRALRSRSTVNFGTQPVSLMGGEGVSNTPKFLKKRLHEEDLVQRINEKKMFWRVAQFTFQRLYYPYKTRLAPSLSRQTKATWK